MNNNGNAFKTKLILLWILTNLCFADLSPSFTSLSHVRSEMPCCLENKRGNLSLQFIMLATVWWSLLPFAKWGKETYSCSSWAVVLGHHESICQPYQRLIVVWIPTTKQLLHKNTNKHVPSLPHLCQPWESHKLPDNLASSTVQTPGPHCTI